MRVEIEYEVDFCDAHGDVLQTRRFRRFSIAEALATAAVVAARGELSEAALVTVSAPKSEAKRAVVVVERNSPAWRAAWEGLGRRLAADRLRSDLVASNNGEGWQLMGSFRVADRMEHEFRHRDHPDTGCREYRVIATALLSAAGEQPTCR